jgi:hypothetical protein
MRGADGDDATGYWRARSVRLSDPPGHRPRSQPGFRGFAASEPVRCQRRRGAHSKSASGGPRGNGLTGRANEFRTLGPGVKVLVAERAPAAIAVSRRGAELNTGPGGRPGSPFGNTRQTFSQERDRGFESRFLQGRVHKPSVPPTISRARDHQGEAAGQRGARALTGQLGELEATERVLARYIHSM